MPRGTAWKAPLVFRLIRLVSFSHVLFRSGLVFHAVCVVQWRRGQLCAVLQPGGLHHGSGRGGTDGSPRLRLLLPYPRGQVGLLTDHSASVRVCPTTVSHIRSALWPAGLWFPYRPGSPAARLTPRPCSTSSAAVCTRCCTWQQGLSSEEPPHPTKPLSNANFAFDSLLKYLVALFFWAVNVPPWLCRNDAECVKCWWEWSSRPPTVIRP